MPDSLGPDERAARRMIDDDKAIATKLAEQQQTAYGKVTATPDEEYDLYWYRDDAVDEQALRATGDPKTGQPLTEAQIAYIVYPKRRKLIYTGTRALSLKERISYVKKMNKRHADALAEDVEEEEED